MRRPPPPALVDLLGRLGLATPGEVRKAWRRVRRLARELPAFESVWADALVQARRLTPFQAAEINAGRGDSLAVGPYVLLEPQTGPAFAATFRARRREAPTEVRLTVVPLRGRDAATALSDTKALVERGAAIVDRTFVAICDCGLEDQRLWVACPVVDGEAVRTRTVRALTAEEWLVHNGRFPPDAVLEIARQMLSGLAACQRADIVHGDLAAGQVWLDVRGRVRLHIPGLRVIALPREEFSNSNLDPRCYDGLAPERAGDGSPPTVASDLFACGCVWWHLLTGRPPLAGATGLAKVQFAVAKIIGDVRELSPDTPPVLAEAISACTSREPSARPESFAMLAERLGPSTQAGQGLLARCLSHGVQPIALSARRAPPVRTGGILPLPRRAPSAALVACGAVMVLAVGTWPFWSDSATRESATAGDKAVHAIPTWTPIQGVPQGEERLAVPSAVGRTRPLLSPPLAADEDPRSTGSRTAESAHSASEQRAAYTSRGQGAVVLAAGTHSLNPSADADRSSGGTDLVLPSGRAVAWTHVRLKPGQVVRAPQGLRATVLVQAAGASIEVEDIRVENVDFVLAPTAPERRAAETAEGDLGRDLALVLVRAARCEFRRCTFSRATTSHQQPAAISWRQPARRVGPPQKTNRKAAATTASAKAPAQDGSRLRLVDCAIGDVSAGVRWFGDGGGTVDLINVLHLGPGPWVTVARWPKWNEVFNVVLRHGTLREAAALIECQCDGTPEDAGAINIRAADCVLAPAEGGGLCVLLGDENPARLLTRIDLRGETTTLAQQTPLVVWQRFDGRRHVAEPSGVDVGGFVQGDLEFAGPADQGPEASRVIRWRGSSRSGQPPGIGEVPRVPAGRDGK